MGKATRGRRTRRTVDALDLPTDAQLANGSFERDFITHAETNTKAMAYRNRESSILETWVRQGGPGFEVGAQRAIADCQLFWSRMGEPRLIAVYGERMAASTHGDGYTQQEAADEIAFRKRMFPRQFWDVFENVVRHNEPAGVAGSRWATNRPQQIAAAKAIVGMVASMMAAKLGY